MLKKEFTLRQYQNHLIRELGIAVKQHRRVIACAATGSGKTKTFLRIAANALNKGYTVLIITESRKIFRQLEAEIHAYEIKPGKTPPILPGRVYIAMAQTLRKRAKLIHEFKLLSECNAYYQQPGGVVNNGLLIINDECHINEATNTLLQLPQALLIGFSGSPIGKHLVKLYEHLVVGPQPHELVLDGFLTPYSHWERKRADITQLELDRAGEYTEESQERVFGTDAVYDGIIEDLTNPVFKWRKALLFTSSIKHCEETADRLRAAGLIVVAVHSNCDKYAKQKGLFNNVKCKPGQSLEDAYLEQFTHGLVPICISVGILTKGFDYPPIDFIGLLRKTSSLALYLQMIGRASRVLEGEEFLPLEQRLKQLFYVFDYGQNVTKHWPWDYERDWQTIWRKGRTRAGVSPIKICPQCDYVNNAHATVCINCGYAFPVLTTEPDATPAQTILIEVTAKYNKLVGRKISSCTAEELSIYAKSKGKKQFAIRVAKWHVRNGDEQFLHDFAHHMGYKRQFVHITLNSMREVLRSNPDERFEFNDQILR